MKSQTRDRLRKAFSHLPHAQFQIPMNPLANPTVAAVHQTLAGERLTYQVQFPATGDPDCDFIQGILAVVKAVDLATPLCTARVLRYLLERFNSQDQPVPKIDWERSIQAAVDRAVYEQQHRFQPPQTAPYVTTTGAMLGSVFQQGQALGIANQKDPWKP